MNVHEHHELNNGAYAQRKVFVFKTSLFLGSDIEAVGQRLDTLKGIWRWNVDREDVDNILRVESSTLTARQIIRQVKLCGYFCEELPG